MRGLNLRKGSNPISKRRDGIGADVITIFV